MDRIRLIESPSERPSKSINDRDPLKYISTMDEWIMDEQWKMIDGMDNE